MENVFVPARKLFGAHSSFLGQIFLVYTFCPVICGIFCVPFLPIFGLLFDFTKATL